MPRLRSCTVSVRSRIIISHCAALDCSTPPKTWGGPTRLIHQHYTAEFSQEPSPCRFNRFQKIDLSIDKPPFYHLIKPGKKTRPGAYPPLRKTQKSSGSWQGDAICSAYKRSSTAAQPILSQKWHLPRAAFTTVLGDVSTESTSTI